MGLFDKVVKVAKDAGTVTANSISAKANEIRHLQEKYALMSDDELIHIASSNGLFGKTQTEKGAAFRELRSRGYNPDDIRSR
ncbi:hypothetical protein [Acidithiobacillus thiooxidans]|uniref:Uncharacterized protein n=1 Tax=Acidithiobacillus thiooxidans ATCC 19377 TaxID=637390 RepID=A0A543PYM3_ACITH|nr:hypothetical protein [Acidithiobacillus thiooxidans]MDX5936765.1 hypothetical protein [Acidithiobacillus thiooxidans]MDX5936777.1 hypothetical protein [Acidithiobacillus thiooxidans]TQN49188.1 hypothetical protein DLNHIDIE_03506 [Acidithiobacillus thiooxidans ATCC 19377]